MKYKWIRSNIYSIKFIISFALIALIIGFVLFNNESNVIKDGVLNSIKDLDINIINSRENVFLIHLGLVSIFIVLSIIVIGMPIFLIYYFYEFVSIGYLLSVFFSYKKFNGLLFGVVFTCINKMLFLVILSYFLINMINYTRKYINSIKLNKNDLIINYLYKCFFVILLVIINDLFLYFLGNKLTSIFLFLI